MKKFSAIFLLISFALLGGFVIPVHAQEAPLSAEQQEITEVQSEAPSGVSPVWRGIQIFSLIAALASLALLIYGAILWRNAIQNNDLLLSERGRSMTVLGAVLFLFFLILLIISFIVIRRQQSSVAEQQQQIQTSGLQGLQTRDALLLIEAIPVGEVPFRNAAVQLIFNQPVGAANVLQNIAVYPRDGETAVNGEWEVDAEYAIFRPSQSCPDPNTNLHCFDANQTYQVQILEDLTSLDGDAFRCSIAASSSQCQFTFTTGEAVDAQSPTAKITLPFDQSGVPVESPVQIEAVGNDEYGIASLHFFVNSEKVGIAVAPGDELTTELRGSSIWETIGLESGAERTIEVQAYDLVANIGNAVPITVELLPLHCSDEVQNEDEEGFDCGGPTCRACQGSTCSANSDCASGLCFEGICQEFPIIEEVIHADGAPGNLVTVRGRNFGSEPGRFLFLGGAGEADDIESPLPPCDNYWSANEVIAQIPEGAQSGNLRIETAAGLFDTTDDSKGVRLTFDVNDIIRPSLCDVSPAEQVIGESVQIIGTNLGEEQGIVKFGQYDASRIEGWANTVISDVGVPSIEPGSLAVTVRVAGEESNPVAFTVQKSPNLPFLEGITPDRGPPGQIFSLRGDHLPPSALVRFLDPRTGESTLAGTDLPRACEKYFSDDQRAYRVSRLDPGVYQVYVESEQGKSNTVDFTVTSGERLPGLCGMEPDNGPLGLEIVLHGEGFGNTLGGVRFNPRIDDAQVLSWTDETVQVVVPPSAQTGPVQVIHQNGSLSNSLNYTVGTCSPDTCSEGFSCCASGACQRAGTCPQSIPFCTYSWLFSTGDDLGGAPRVIEDASCTANTQSPSPFKDTKDACLNGQISARFTHDMNDESLSLDNITLRRCNSGALLDSSQCETDVNLSSIMVINSGQTGEGFIASPQLRLQPDTWYEVVLSTGFTATNGLSMLQPYRWAFKTQVGEEECQVDRVEVTPPNATLRQIKEQQKYTAVPTALNCNILNPDEYTWGWLSSDTSKARVQLTDAPRNTAAAFGPTDPGPPVEIIASIPEESVSDEGLLTVRLAPPTVVQKWPNCNSACVNAIVGARFDQPMEENSVTNTQNIQLFKCTDNACSRGSLSPVSIKSLRYNVTDLSLFFVPSADLFEAGAKYRVVLKNLRGTSGLALGGLNFDSDDAQGFDSYSWIFTVRDNTELCEIDNVEVIPPFATSYLIKEELDYFSFPVSPPDACSEAGQLLNPEVYDWGWLASDEAVGTVSRNDLIPPQGLIDPYQITTAEGPGQTQIEAGTLGVSGSGQLDVVCGFERDIDCPAPATVASHGVGNNSCCYARPEVASLNPPDGAQAVCTTLAVEVEFNQNMNLSSLLTNIVLEQNYGASACPGQNVTAWQKVKGYGQKLWSWIIPSTNAQAENWCEVESSAVISSTGRGSKATVYPRSILASNTQFRVRIIGDADINDGINQGIRNFNDVSMNGSTVSTFTTGDAECSLDIVDISVDPPGEPGRKDIFFCAVRNDCPGDTNPAAEGNQHTYTATGRDLRGYAVPADFTWFTNNQSLVHLNTEEGNSVEVTSDPINGNASVTVIGRAVSPSQGEVANTVDVKIFLCENPWPSILDFPYTDVNFNYDTFYCRDFGDPGPHDDLPPLSGAITSDNVGEFLRETLFVVE